MNCAHCVGAEAAVRVRIGKVRYPLCAGCALKLDSKDYVSKTVKELARLHDRRRRTQRAWERA